MKITAIRENVNIFSALASDMRLEIIRLLGEQDMNISQIASALNISSAITTKHIKKLEQAGIVGSRAQRGSAGTQKMCYLEIKHLEIDFPYRNDVLDYKTVNIPVGHYSHIEARPTCGIATSEHFIGQFDNPRYFYSPERMDASILWFTTGSVSYTFLNPLLSSQMPTSIEISMEICSEAPGYDENWPSDIEFYLNDIWLGMWTSPGDFASSRGRYTPSWWSRNINQYGLLKIIKISNEGTFIDGEKMSDVTLDQLASTGNSWSLRMSVDESAVNPGGLTIYGKNFGNYNQDIVVKTYYKTLKRN